jgi:hypothetical protein
MDSPRLGCNKSFSNHKRAGHQHLRSQHTPCCPPTKWRESAINAHLHSRSPRAASRRQKCSHHPWPCIALPPVHRCNVQCWLYCHLHQDWMLHNVLWPHYRLRPKMHAHWPVWMVPLQQGHTNPSTQPATTSPATTAMAANIKVKVTLSASKYARYIHQLLCSPPASTLL